MGLAALVVINNCKLSPLQSSAHKRTISLPTQTANNPPQNPNHRSCYPSPHPLTSQNPHLPQHQNSPCAFRSHPSPPSSSSSSSSSSSFLSSSLSSSLYPTISTAALKTHPPTPQAPDFMTGTNQTVSTLTRSGCGNISSGDENMWFPSLLYGKDDLALVVS